MCPSDDTPDDRAAILARRQRFIALALSGLATACTLPDCGSPEPCLDVKAPPNSNREWAERERARKKQLEATPTPSPPPARPPDPEPTNPKADPTADPKADPKGTPPPVPH